MNWKTRVALLAVYIVFFTVLLSVVDMKYHYIVGCAAGILVAYIFKDKMK